jgi:hypothetical protein
MWTAHAETFFSGNLFNKLFGFQRILADPKFAYEPLVGPLAMEEAHNNTFRTIIFFGIVGYFFYSLFIRWLVIRRIILLKIGIFDLFASRALRIYYYI